MISNRPSPIMQLQISCLGCSTLQRFRLPRMSRRAIDVGYMRRTAARQPGRISVKLPHASQDSIREARTQQIQATDLLAKLLQAPNTQARLINNQQKFADAQATALEHVDSLTEEFFMMSSTYLEMARKEGNADVLAKLEKVLKVAMDEKQKTLRPEIQLLNTLLACKTPAERKEVFAAPETKERMLMNDRYFFTNLLDRMIKDVSQQKSNAKQLELARRLHELRSEAVRVADF